MPEPIFVYGASGHAKVVIDAIEKQGLYRVDFLIDDDPALQDKTVYGYTVRGGRETIFSSALRRGIVAIGSNAARAIVTSSLITRDIDLVTVIHPSAQIARGVTIGRGTVLMANTAVNSDTTIGQGCIVNTGATIDHDCVIGDFAHIAPGCHLCGNVQVGARSLVGVGSSVIPGISLGEDVLVGGGSSVISDVPHATRVAGVPSRSLGH